MAIIGIFSKQEDGGYSGTIQTLTYTTRAYFKPLAKRGDKSPDYHITGGLSEFGAAWTRAGEKGEAYLSVRLDDPGFAAPVNCRLIKGGIEDGYNLIWERDRKRS